LSQLNYENDNTTFYLLFSHHKLHIFNKLYIVLQFSNTVISFNFTLIKHIKPILLYLRFHDRLCQH